MTSHVNVIWKGTVTSVKFFICCKVVRLIYLWGKCSAKNVQLCNSRLWPPHMNYSRWLLSLPHFLIAKKIYSSHIYLSLCFFNLHINRTSTLEVTVVVAEMCFCLWGLEWYVVNSGLPRLLIGSWRRGQKVGVLSKRPVWIAPPCFIPSCVLGTLLKFICSSLENPSMLLFKRCLRTSLMDTFKVFKSRLTRHTFCGQSSIGGTASASRRGVAEWHFPDDRWTRPLMALPRMHLDVCLMLAEAEQRWAREQITQLTSAVHQSGYCGMLNGYFHLPSTCYDNFSMATDYISGTGQLDQKRSRYQKTWPILPCAWIFSFSF